jgi:hypothetical protein
MPIHRGVDVNGSFYQWGDKKKYYYIPGSKRSRDYAKSKALKQAIAIYASGFRRGSRAPTAVS